MSGKLPSNKDWKMTLNKKGGRKIRRNFILRLFCLILLGFSCFGWIRTLQTLQDWELIVSITNSLVPIYLLGLGIIWGGVGILSAVALWWEFKYSRLITICVVFFFPLSSWIEEIWILKSPTRLSSWPFNAGITILWLAFGLWVVLRSKPHQE
jgi:hypothetical protein